MQNNKIILYFFNLLMIIAFMQSCNSGKTIDNNGYVINGKIKGVEDGKVLLAKLDLKTNEQVNVDSTEMINGKFTLKGEIDSPYLYTLFINGKSNKIHFFLENSSIEIKADFSKLDQAKVIGSREDSLFRSYKMDDIFDRKKGMEIMLDHSDYTFSAFTAYYQFQIYNISADTLDHIMNNFKNPVKKTVYFEHLTNLYNTLKNVAISQPAPDFSIPDTDGNLVQLKDFRGRYVLIDFWASWCAPCRASNPTLVNVYKTFKNRDFTIVGISIDKDKERWLKAIKADQLPWTNISNLKGWDEVSGIYGVKAVPQNFLIDPDGIIIDKNMEPDLMVEKLNGILPR